MALNQEDWHKILVALSSGDEKKIFKVLYEKKVIDDKSPKLRTEDEKKKLKSLSNQMRYFPEKLIEGIEKKFPFLQRKRTPKTAEQRKEQDKEYHRQKLSAESQIDKEMRLNKQKDYENEKRCGESDIEKKGD